MSQTQTQTETTNRPPTIGVLPVRRDLKFRLDPEKIATWNKDDKHLTHFMNTLSIFFPVGERFFIASVRNYRDQITDPELQKAVTAFIGQEAMHGREHEEYNDALYAQVPVARDMEKFVAVLLAKVQKFLPKSTQLSATIALEHFTAILADGLLREPEVLRNADPAFANIWNWHALEETEHKAVAYDVWETVFGRGPRAYAERASGLVMATVIFWAIAVPFYLRVLQSEQKLTDLKGWAKFAHFTVGKVGFLRKRVLPWADYFRPNFHPWDHDNAHFLQQIDSLVDDVEAAAVH